MSLRWSSLAATTYLLCLARAAQAEWNHTAYSNRSSELPIVDLGYQIHQAGSFNESGNYYNFSNIRYAAPPVGELRFRAPTPPAVNRAIVDTGSIGRICPQASPAWEAVAEQFIAQLLTAQPINITVNPANAVQPPLDPRTNEDCLFLDVLVPAQILKNRTQKGVPVLVWIFGGGFTAGDKAGINTGNPAGLVGRSNNSIIFVAINYRLGAFGWLSGPSFQANGTSNVGLHDQRFGLKWVQDHIAKFGGDPNQVTVIGESAGGSSIMHQITAYGGASGPGKNNGSLFDKAIMQSPGFLPLYSNQQQEQIFSKFLALANVTSIEEARKLPIEALIRANFQHISASSYGSFTYGPAVDGDIVPALPGILLAENKFNTNIKVMVSHNVNEGLFFTSPMDTNETEFELNIRANIPSVSETSLMYITETLYPQIYDGTHGYTTPIQRASLSGGELGIICNTFYLDTAFKNKTYAYRFSIPPALHGDDVYYTFYNNEGAEGYLGPNGVQSVSAAVALQDWIVTFTKTGIPTSPNVPSAPAFPVYGPDANIANIAINQDAAAVLTTAKDDAANSRCVWWQKALYM